MSTDTITPALRAYIDCALWAGLDWNGVDEPDGPTNPEPLDRTYTLADLAPETLRELAEDVAAFMHDNADDLAAGDWSDEQAGHDFFLTRNSHGAGFWDRGRGPVGDRLTAAAKVYGTSELYPGDDGRLYLHN